MRSFFLQKLNSLAPLATAVLAVGTVAFVSWTAPEGPLIGAAQSLGRVGLWSAALVVGARLGAWIVGSRLSGWSHLTWDGAVGLGVLMSAWLWVGLLPGGFRPAAIVGVLVVATVVALLRSRRDPVNRLRSTDLAPRPGAWLTLAMTAVVCLGLIWDRVPVLFFDTLSYHYAQPELWLIHGRIGPETWNLHSWFPPGMSVLYGVGLALGGEPWANDANLLFGIVLLLLAFDLGKRLWGSATGWVAMGWLLTFPQIPFAMAIPGADLGHGLFAVGALGALFVARRDDAKGWSRRAAWLAASAVLTKYLGFAVPLALGALWVLLSPMTRSPRIRIGRRVRAAICFAVPALVVIAPWLIANGVVVGNPVAPVLAETMQPRGLAHDGARSFRVDARGGWPDLDDLRSLGPGLIWGDEDASRIYPSPAWGWTWVALLPALALAMRFDPRLRGLLLLAAVLFVIWFLTYRWERFLVAVSLLLAVAAAAATVRAWRHGGVARGLPIAAALVGLLSFVQAGQTVVRFTGGADVALGLETPRDLVERSIPITRLYREAGENLPASGSRVLLLGEMRHFRLPLPHAAPSAFNTHPLVESLTDGSAVSQANRALRDQGFTHLIVDPGWVRRSAERYPSLALFRDRPDLLSAYLETLGSPVAVRNGVALFRIPE